MIELRAVRLENWRSHGKSEFSFSPGTNVLLGTMGAGKSSLVSAIVFAFFGETPDTRARRARLDDMILEGAENAQIDLELLISGNAYSITRKIERGKGSSSAELRLEGKLVEGPLPAKVTGAVESLLGLDYVLFNQAVYLEQNQIDAFLWAGKGGRRALLDGFFGIEKVEEARRTLLAVAGRFRAEAEILGREDFSAKVSSGKAALEAEANALSLAKGELESASAEFSKVSTELGKTLARAGEIEAKLQEETRLLERGKVLSEKVRALGAKLEAYGGRIGTPESEGELSALESSRSKAEKLWRERTALSAKKELSARRIALISRKLSALLPEIKAESARAEFEAADKSFVEASSELSEAKRELALAESAEKRTASLEKALGPIAGSRAEYNQLSKKLSELSAKILSAERELAEIESSLELVSSERAECPVCGSKLTNHKFCEIRDGKRGRKRALEKALAELGAERKNSERALEKASRESERASEIEAELKELGKLAGKAGKLGERVPRLDSALRDAGERRKEAAALLERTIEAEKLRAELSEQETEAASVASELELLEASLSKIPPLEKLEREISEKRSLVESYRIHLELEETSGAAESAKRAAAELSGTFSREEHRALKAAAEGLSRKSGALQYALQDLPGKISAGEGRILKLRKEISEAEGKEARKGALQKALDLSRQIDLSLRETEQILRNETISEINSALASFWKLLYPYENYSSARLSTEENDYILEFLSGGNWLAAERVASGGEKSVGCLALRIAFSKTLAPGAGLLILDEPTHNLDSNAISLMTSVFREGISEIAPQAILITHEEELEAAATGYCYRLERDSNQPTVVKTLSEGEV